MDIANLTYRKATISDVKTIVMLLAEDELGQTREQLDVNSFEHYINTFHKIDSDYNQYLMVVLMDEKVVGTCHLHIMPSLTFMGSIRMQIEAVRVASEYRNRKIGEWMINSAIEYGKVNGVSIVQLTTNKKRLRAKQFYERLGFDASHEGMKLFLRKI